MNQNFIQKRDSELFRYSHFDILVKKLMEFPSKCKRCVMQPPFLIKHMTKTRIHQFSKTDIPNEST
jgi:hypothetical protein